MRNFDFEKYVGLQYKEKGRDFDGVDCWGLARLIYKNEFAIELPSFTNDYDLKDEEGVASLISHHKEGWEKIDSPEVGSLVLMKILGHDIHVGVMVNDKQFIDIRENRDSVINNIDAPTVKTRIVGFFKYDEKASIQVNGIPHPLKTQKYNCAVYPGSSLQQIAEVISQTHSVPEEYEARMVMLHNGKVIDQKDWPITFVKEQDSVEYRVVPGKQVVAAVAVIAIAIYAPQIATYALQQSAVYAAGAGLTISAGMGAFIYYGTMAAVMLLGNALISRINPVRPPSEPTDPGSSERQLMVNGGANKTNPYGAIPVILGKVKVTPPLGANTYLSYENNRDSYMSLLMVWGYGPLDIDETSFKIGDVPLINYTDYEIITLDRKTAQDTTAFNQIYGNDIDQVQVNLDLSCPGNPEGTPSPGPWLETASTQSGNYTVKIAVHFPQGLRKIKIKGDGSGNSYSVSVKLRFEQSTDGITWVDLAQETVSGKYKDAFTKVFKYDTTSSFIRARRETGDNTEDNPDYRYYFQSTLLNVAYVSNQSPAIDPNGCELAKSALRIKATDQLNGNMEGFNAVVQTYAKVWNGSAWVMGATSNPAALMRYVLEHPANPRRITSDSQLDLAQLQHFYEYCELHGFEYNGVLANARSVLDVVRDICAAGRASPALINGQWSVTIDEAKPVVQHFTPHNSWNFEGTKALPKHPHGLRVTYYDQDQNYQEAEIIVYDVGYSQSNASLFESISLPGVTKKSLVIDHARWHFAQIKLRPEIYTLNTDVEYIVCSRGDRVKVMHDVAMWGLGSGRVKNRISSTVFELDEELPFKAFVNYSIRVRGKDGRSTVATITGFPVDGNYSTITLTSALTADQMDAGDLFLFGELNQESQDLTVISIEPAENKSARITLVDYGVTDSYDIFNDYLNLTESVIFESQISQPPQLLLPSFGDSVPTITGAVSDESVMEQISKGIFRYNMSIAYYNPYSLPVNTAVVEAQYDLITSVDSLNAKYVRTDYQTGSIEIKDVIEGETYKVRARYISNTGVVGKWSSYFTHTVVGKSNPPSEVAGVYVQADKSSGQLIISWDKNPEIDIAKYEIRSSDSLWGDVDGNLVFSGDTTSASIPFINSLNYYIKALDYSGNYAIISTEINYTATAVPAPSNFIASFSSVSLTNVVCQLSWDSVTTSEFNIAYYEIEYDGIVEKIQTTSFGVPATWVGTKIFSLRAVDINGQISANSDLPVVKQLPNSPTNLRTQVIDNTVMLYWNLPVITTLPIDHVIIKRGDFWETPDAVIGQKKGEFTTSIENKGGNFTYWIAAVDTSGQESSPVSVTTLVSEPPDFIFHGDFTSSFDSVKESAVLENGYVIMPLNATETWEDHFLNNSFSSPQDQITAGYPYYVQPTVATGYYEEVFDFGSILSSSKIDVVFTGEVVASPVSPVCSISISDDNVSYTTYDGTTNIYGTNFRYVKIRITANNGSDTGIYKLNSLYVKLDAKLKTEASKTFASSADTDGTIVNFTKEFIDVQSITTSANSTSFANPVYNFKDVTMNITYSLVSYVCTVTYSNHGLVAGQKVRLYFSSGTAISGVYTITSATTNTFSVDMIASDSTGNGIAYPQSLTLYLFDASGSRISGDISWSIRGY